MINGACYNNFHETQKSHAVSSAQQLFSGRIQRDELVGCRFSLWPLVNWILKGCLALKSHTVFLLPAKQLNHFDCFGWSCQVFGDICCSLAELDRNWRFMKTFEGLFRRRMALRIDKAFMDLQCEAVAVSRTHTNTCHQGKQTLCLAWNKVSQEGTVLNRWPGVARADCKTMSLRCWLGLQIPATAGCTRQTSPTLQLTGLKRT